MTDPAANLLMFDLDGTLIDSRRDIATAVNLMRADYGLPALPVDTIAGYVGDGISVLVERSLEDHDVPIEDATRLCAAHYGEHLCDHTELYPRVHEGLQALRAAGWRLAMISNKPAPHCRALLEHFDLVPLFDCVLGAGDTRLLKPDPEPLLRAITETGASANTAWMIGDHWTDLEAARRAEVPAVFLTHGIGEPKDLEPAHVMHSFDEVTRFFLKEIAETGPRDLRSG